MPGGPVLLLLAASVPLLGWYYFGAIFKTIVRFLDGFVVLFLSLTTTDLIVLMLGSNWFVLLLPGIELYGICFCILLTSWALIFLS